MEKVEVSGEKLKNKWESFERDHSYGVYSWPQRNFVCNFCKKEYKSAQALGGHMNVHRRDRARLRLSSSWDYPNPNPNPIFSPPSPSVSSAAVRFLPYHSSLPSLEEEKRVPLVGAEVGDNIRKKMKGSVQENECRVWKKREIVKLKMEMSLLRDANVGCILDLELRLGRS